MGPINYNLDLQSPFQAVAQGYQLGAGIRVDQQQQAQLALQQQQAQQQQQVIRNLIGNPNAGAADYANAMVLVPGLKDQLTAAWKTKNDAQMQAGLADMSQYASAIDQGQPQIASAAMRAKADAMEHANGGQPTPSSQALRTQADVVDAHPDFASFQMKATMAAQGEQGSKLVDQLAAIRKQPVDLAKANADAVSATAKAQVDAATVNDQVTKSGLDNAKTQQDIDASKLQGRIAELNTQIAQANSETQRGQLQLERDKLTQQQAQLKQTQGQAAQDSQDAATAALQTVNDIRNHPGLKDSLWQKLILAPSSTAPGSMWGALAKKLPQTDRGALETYVDSLKSQLAFNNLMEAKRSSPTGASGFGALSEGELKLLSNIVGNLNTDSNDFPKQLDKVQQFLEKTQQKGVANPNLPTAGGAAILTSPKYGVVREGDINRVMQQNPGATRAQVIQFLQQQGGQAIPTR